MLDEFGIWIYKIIAHIHYKQPPCGGGGHKCFGLVYAPIYSYIHRYDNIIYYIFCTRPMNLTAAVLAVKQQKISM